MTTFFLRVTGFLGFGPEGGRSPVEHRGNLYVRTSIHPSVPPLAKGLTEAGLGLQEASSGLPGACTSLSKAISGPSEASSGL